MRDDCGQTLLIISAAYGYEKCLHSLIKAGVDLNERDMHGQTALIKVATKGFDNSIHKLINAGTNMYVTDKIGETAFCASAKHGHNMCLRKLINGKLVKCTFLGLNTGDKHCNAKAINQSALIETDEN